MGPKGHVLMRFHIIKKKKKKNKADFIPGRLSLKILMELFDNDVDERSYEVCICLWGQVILLRILMKRRLNGEIDLILKVEGRNWYN